MKPLLILCLGATGALAATPRAATFQSPAEEQRLLILQLQDDRFRIQLEGAHQVTAEQLEALQRRQERTERLGDELRELRQRRGLIERKQAELEESLRTEVVMKSEELLGKQREKIADGNHRLSEFAGRVSQIERTLAAIEDPLEAKAAIRERHTKAVREIEYEARLAAIDRRIMWAENDVLTAPQVAPKFDVDAGVPRMVDDAFVVNGQSEIKAPVEPLVIEDDFLAARARAAAKGIPLLVSFTGHTCIMCRQMEVTVFEEDDVKAQRGGMVEARLYSDAAVAAARKDNALRIESVAKTFAQPVWVVLNPRTGEELARSAGPKSAAEFSQFLASGSDKLAGSMDDADDALLWRAIFELEDELRAVRQRLASTAASENR